MLNIGTRDHTLQTHFHTPPDMALDQEGRLIITDNCAEKPGHYG